MTLFNENEKRKIIMDYYLNPRKRKIKLSNHYKNYKNIYVHSNQCIDEIKLFFNNNKDDFFFIAQGCAICISSSEIFIEIIMGLGFNETEKLINLYIDLINKKKLNKKDKSLLGKLNIYENVSNHLNRKECALLITEAFKKILNK